MITGDIASTEDTLNPSWSSAVVTRVRAEDLSEGLTILIWDSDIDFDDLMVACVVDTSDSERLFSGMIISLDCAATEFDGTETTEGTVRFRLEPG